MSFNSFDSSAQQVGNRKCPDSYFRNNGNGQYVTDFASNIDSNSVYFSNALSSGNQGNLTFKWGEEIFNPPVINKTWLTNTDNITTADWTFGDNLVGSPFNPPGIPAFDEVKYTFYYNNLPTAGTITLELIDPFDGSMVNTCSYPLSKGATSGGSKVSLAVNPPSDFYYSPDTAYTDVGTIGNSAEPTINSGGGSITYSLISAPAGVTISDSTGVLYWDASLPIGSYNITVNASNGLSPDVTADYVLIITEEGVSSGNDGGLESESLGGALAERVFKKKLEGQTEVIDYNNFKLLDLTTMTKGTQNLANLVPTPNDLGTGYKAYVTSPTDLLGFTNAEDIISVDYTKDFVNKAVALCVETKNGVYSHTKPVCDRLKGSELMKVNDVSIAGYDFIRYELKADGSKLEYAISFSIGMEDFGDEYFLQSTWLLDGCVPYAEMYNFQLWSSDEGLLTDMVQSVLNKFEKYATINQIQALPRPSTYVTKMTRAADNQLRLNVDVFNDTEHENALLIINQKENEQSAISTVKEIEVGLNPKGMTQLSLELNDASEAEIELLINNKKEDFVYVNDGIWNYFQTPNCDIQEFSVSNDHLEPTDSDYRLFRNVKIKAQTSDYVTVYRMLRGNSAPVDLSEYNFLKFTSEGEGEVRIRIIKNSVDDFNKQFQYNVTLLEGCSEYNIDLRDFYSNNSHTTTKFNDVTIVSFTYEVDSGSELIEHKLSNVHFSKTKTPKKLDVRSLFVYPNPVSDQLSFELESNRDELANVVIIQASSGKVMYDATINLFSGDTQYRIPVSDKYSSGIYIMKVITAEDALVTRFAKVKR